MTDNTSNSAIAVKDPVCGMTVNPATAKHSLSHKGQPHFFCCSHCAEKFKASPEKYLAPRPTLVTLAAPAIHPAPGPANQANYICPMCPQVRGTKPGPCP